MSIRPCSLSAVLLLLAFCATMTLAAKPTSCASLITYRQFSTLLEAAPTCFRNGCGSNSSLTTVSSSCSSQAPCQSLFSILKGHFETDACASCQNDIACRIPGWPILNATTTCEFIPHEWLFNNANGLCCGSGSQPFALAKWIGDMCNETWRRPFDYYGGMAKLDWEEWIQPWNWTVRSEGHTSKPFTPSSCSAVRNLGLFAVEELSAATWAILNLIFWYYVLEWSLQSGTSKRKIIAGRILNGVRASSLENWVARKLTDSVNRGRHANDRVEIKGVQLRPIITGLGLATIRILSNYVSAYLTKHTPGFENVPFTQLALLFGTRPRFEWLICVVAFFNRTEKYGSSIILFANHVMSFAVCEIVLQLYSSAYLGKTVNTGRKKGFYLAHHLAPYWRGQHALTMYAGALIWAIWCSVFIIVWVVLLIPYARFIGLLDRSTRGRLAKHKLQGWWAVLYSVMVGPEEDEQEASGRPRSLRWWQRAVRWISRKRSAHSGALGDKTLDEDARSEPTAEVVENEYDRDWRTWATIWAMFLGFLSFLAQWLFWGGFVTTAGER